jgi:RNA polymerase sigma-70 factor, ECF subfamily
MVTVAFFRSAFSPMEKRMAKEVVEAFERCLRRYPAVQISYEEFQARIDEILSHELSLSDEQSRRKALALIHHEDLFLAMACSRQDRVAWEYFADDYMQLLRKFSTQACSNSAEGEDLAQEITAKMLKESNRLARYNGRGSLAGWLRAAVSHAAVDRFRRTRKQVSLEDLPQNSTPPDLIDPGNKDEDEALDARWGPVISNVASESISKLAARDRLVLGLYYLRGVSLKAIGRQFGMHEATVSRRLDRLRRDIRKQVEVKLRKKHWMSAGEIRSLWKHISISSVADPIVGTISPAPVTNSVETKNRAVPAQKKSARRKD